MTAFLMICVPLLVLAMVAGVVLIWAYKRVPQSPGHQPYDAGEGDIEDLELEVHMARKPTETRSEFIAKHAPSSEIAELNKSLYVGVFAGGEHGDEAIASHVKDIEVQRKNADDLRYLVRQQALSDLRVRRWAWLPWRRIGVRRSRIQALTQEVESLKMRLRYLDGANPIDDAPRSRAMAKASRAAQEHWDSGAPLREMMGGADDV
jgi:hypothetical protein